MVSKIRRQGTNALQGALASLLALLAFAICMPRLAFAQESTQVIDGIMTITVQGGASGGGAGGGAGVSSVITTSTTTTSGGISSSVLTGDILIWLILGIAVLIAGAVYVFIKSRKLASAGVSAGALVKDPTSAKRNTIIVAVVVALVACVCFGIFASKSNAFAKEVLAGVSGTSTVVVDEQGTVISNDLVIANNSDEDIFINSIQAPDELKDWNASIKGTTLDSGSFVEGSWDGKTIPASLLDQVKNKSNSSIELTLKVSITKALDFDKFTFDAEGLAYNGKQIAPPVTCDAYQQGTDYEVTYGENKNAGEGTITIKGCGNYKGEKTFTFTIGQKELPLKWDDQASFTYEYDGKSHVPSATISGEIIEGDTVNIAVDGAQTNAGTYNATAKIDNSNYKLPDKATQSFTITQKEVSLAWSADSFTYNGQAQGPTATAGNIVEGDKVNVTVEGAQINVGANYMATATALSNANYKLPAENTKEFSISKAKITVSGIVANSKTYDGTANATLDYKQVVLKGKVAGDDLSVSAEGAFEDANAGTAKKVIISNLNLTGASCDNYRLVTAGQQSEATADINPALLDQSKITVVADGATYTGEQITPKVISGVYEQDEDYSVTYGENINAGIDAGSVAIEGKGNYQGKIEQTFTINAKQLILNWDKQTSFVYDGSPHAPNAGVDGVVKGDSVALVISGAQTNAGTYSASASIDNTNYSLPSESTKAFTIAKAEITVSGIVAQDKTYDGTIKAELDFSKVILSGKIDGDDLTISAKGAFEDADAGSDKKVIISDLILAGKSVANYELAKIGQQTSAKATVSPASINPDKIVISSEGTTYTGSQLTPQVTIEGLTRGTDFDVSYGENIKAGKEAGSLIVTGKGNYTGEYSKIFEIKKADPNPTAPEGLTAETGQTLADVTLPRQAEPVAGSFAWEAEDPSKVFVGEADTTPSFNAIFTPDDTNNYNTQVVPVAIKVTKVKSAFAVYFADGTLGFYHRVDIPKEKDKLDGKTVAQVYKNIENDNYQPEWLNEKITSATVVDSGIQPKSTANWFAFNDASKLTNVDVAKLNTSQVTSMASMFKGCGALTTVGDLSNWDAASVTDMSHMFEGCTGLASIGDVSDWNTSNVTTMDSTFAGCVSLDSLGDLSKWNENTASVTNMTATFKNCTKLTADCSKWTVKDNVQVHTDFDTNAPGVQSPWDEELDFNLFNVNTDAVTYNGSQFKPTVSTTVSKYKEGEAYEVVYGENKNAGEGTVTIKGLNKYYGEKTYTFTINQKELALTWGEQASFTYDGTSHAPCATIGEVIPGDTVNLSIEGAQTNASDKTYEAIAKIDNANYKLVGATTKEFTIARAKITVSGITAHNKEYDGTANVEFDYTKATLAGKVGEDDLKLSATGAFKDANAGTGKIVNIANLALDGKSAKNYELAEQGQQTSTLADITQREVELEWGNTTFVYNRTSYLPEAWVKNPIKGDEVTVTVEGAQTDAGSDYTATAIALSNANYKLPEVTTQSFTIEQKEVNLVWTGDVLSYNGKPQAPTATAQGVIEGDAVTVIVGGMQTNANEEAYTATAIALSNKNYKLPAKVTKLFYISKAEITVSGISANSKEYDGTTKVSLNFSNAVLDGKVEGEDLTVTAEGIFENANAGTAKEVKIYKLSLAGADTSNYELAEQGQQSSTTADITPRVVDLKWGSLTLTYTGTAQVPQVFVKNAIQDDTVNVTVKSVYEDDCIKVGAYQARPVALDNANYKLPDTIYPQTFFITSASLVVSNVSGKDKVYDGDRTAEIDTSKAIFDGLKGKDKVSVSATGLFDDANAGEDKNIVIDSYTLSGKDAGNYRINYKASQSSTSATITRAPIDLNNISVSSEGCIYTGARLTPEVMVENFVEGVDYTVIYGENIRAGKDTGSATVEGIGNCSGIQTKTFDIAKAEPVCDVPEDITAEVGQTLAQVKLPEQTSSTKGAFIWKDVTQSVGEEGNHKFIAIFTPADTNNYKTVEVEIPVEVTKEKTAFAVYFAEDSSLNFYNRVDVPKVGDTFDNKTVSAVYDKIETTNYRDSGAPWNDKTIKTVKVIDQGIQPVSTARWFEAVNKVDPTTADVSKLDISKTTDMMGMFYACTEVASVGDISQWDTSSVANMHYMFYDCNKLSLDCSNWNVDKVGEAHQGFNEHADGVISPWDTKTAFAIYSDTDYSLNFYNRTSVPAVGDTFEGKVVTALYKDIETSTYAYSEKVPWYKYRYDIESASVVDKGITPISTAFWFSHCEYLTSADVSKLDTSRTTLMAEMFEDCAKLTSLDVSNFNTSNVTNMAGMFAGCSRLVSIEGLLNWDTSNVTNMREMFSWDCELETIPVSGFNTSRLKNASGMFTSCSKLSSLDLSQWDVSSVENMNRMFQSCGSLVFIGGISQFDTSSVSDMGYMFHECSRLTADCSGWNIDRVYDNNHRNFNYNALGVTSPWDNPAFAIYSATDNSLRFYKANAIPTEGSTYKEKEVTALYKDIDTDIYDKDSIPWVNYRSSITTVEAVNRGITPFNMSSWFSGCTALRSVDLSKLYTVNVYDMSEMFNGCSNLTSVNLSGFDTSNVTNMNSMFNGCSKLSSADISGFNTSQVTDMGKMFNSCSAWSDFDLSSWDTSKVKNMSSMFARTAITSTSFLSGLNVSCVEDMQNMFYGSKINDLSGLAKWNTKSLKNMCEMFANCKNLSSANLSRFDTSQVTNMAWLFRSCSALTVINMSGIDTSKVQTMRSMFAECTSLENLDVSGLDTSNVTDMSNLFFKCKSLSTVSVENWSTTVVTDMNHMFYGCSSLKTLNLSNFSVSYVKDMSYMFYGCPKLKSITGENVSSLYWNVGRVTNMCSMFEGCNKLEAKLASWNVDNVTNMNSMFRECYRVNTNLGGWNVCSVTNMDYMFYNCYRLTTNLSDWDVRNVMSHIDFSVKTPSEFVAPSWVR